MFTGHSEENVVGNTMGAFVGIDGTKLGDAKPTEIADDQLNWKNYQVMAGKSSPLLINDKVYVTTDSAKMLVFDSHTGQQLERKALGRSSRGTPLYADGKIYYASRGGRFFVLQPQPDGSLKTLSKANLRGEQADASPIVAGGRIYLTTSAAVYCIGNQESVSANSSNSRITKDEPVAQPGAPNKLAISPYDVLVEPGEMLTFTARLFDNNGVECESGTSEVPVEWSVDSTLVRVRLASQLDSRRVGAFTAPKDASHQCALVTAKWGELTATARVRIVPPLPWNFDFENLDKVPLTWVGGRIRYNLREDADGNHYLAKPIELPTRPGKPTTKLGTRSRMWMGPSDLSDYTIQADVRMQTGLAGEVIRRADEPQPEFPRETSSAAIKLPSTGLINSRYTFTLFGPAGEARLYSWCTHDKRTQASVAMKFEPKVWYTMKLKVVPKPDEQHAHVYAKVWKRDEVEPSDWTLEIEDEAPNLQGSPGLFGDAKEAEFYVDNLSVTPN